MIILNKDNIIKYLFPKGWHSYHYELFESLVENKIDWFQSYASPDKRFVLQTTKDSNLPTESNGLGWNLHVDSNDMCTIANCSVRTIEEVEALIEIYKNY